MSVRCSSPATMLGNDRTPPTSSSSSSSNTPANRYFRSNGRYMIKTDETPEEIHQNRQQQLQSGSSELSATATLGTAYVHSESSSIQDDCTMMECDDVGPISRDRCNTWPLRRPQIGVNPQSSPLIHEQIPEEDNDMYNNSSENISDDKRCSNIGVGMIASPEAGTFSSGLSPPLTSSGINSGQLPAASADLSDTCAGLTTSKKSTTRRNAWGNMSYADLITQAILSSPDKRLTLSQVYEWMVQNVPYFRDKGDSNSSAGWKNSIRHNLSLHSRFTRLQNEGAGKSSWWVINPDAKPGRSPRRPRSSTFDTSSKAAIEKKRRGAKKKALEIRESGGMPTLSTSGSHASVVSRDLYTETDDSISSYSLYRNLTPTTLSIPVSQSENFDDYEFPQFLDSSHIPADLVDRTRQMNVNQEAVFHHALANGAGVTSPAALSQHLVSDPTSADVESETNCGDAPPSYLDISDRYGNSNAQMRLQLSGNTVRVQNAQGVGYGNLFSLNQQQNLHAWGQSGDHFGHVIHHQMGSSQQSQSSSSALPLDLQNLSVPDFGNDPETIYRNDLGNGSMLNFDNVNVI